MQNTLDGAVTEFEARGCVVITLDAGVDAQEFYVELKGRVGTRGFVYMAQGPDAVVVGVLAFTQGRGRTGCTGRE